MAEYEIEELVNDLELPRDVIQEDVAKGRLVIYQHNRDPKYYVDHDEFVDYLTERVVDLRDDQKRAFWCAVKKIIDNPTGKKRLADEDRQAVMQALDREIAKCS